MLAFTVCIPSPWNLVNQFLPEKRGQHRIQMEDTEMQFQIKVWRYFEQSSHFYKFLT